VRFGIVTDRGVTASGLVFCFTRLVVLPVPRYHHQPVTLSPPGGAAQVIVADLPSAAETTATPVATDGNP
jgi:hypothetical protein